MKKLLAATIIYLSLTTIGIAQHDNHPVHWYTIEEAEELSKTDPKPIMIDVSTEWCGWCKKMMITTFADKQVAQYLNENFYPVAYDAESRDTITFRGESFAPRPMQPGSRRKPTHPFTGELIQSGRLSYPTIIFYQPNFQQGMIVPGYQDANGIAPFLVYYKELIYQSDNINNFMADFKKTYEPKDTSAMGKGKVNWIGMQEALDANAKSPKKIYVQLTGAGCNSCRVMDSTTYKNEVIANYLNENYYCVLFDVNSKEEINFINDQVLVNQTGIHQLAQAALQQNFKLPASLFFDEHNNLITPVPEYMTPRFLEAVLIYFKEDKHQTIKFPDYYKDFKGSVN